MLAVALLGMSLAQSPALEMPTPSPRPAPVRLPRWVAVVASGAATAALGMGIAFEIDAQLARASGTAVATASVASALYGRATTSSTVSTGALIGTVVLAVATAVVAGFTRWSD